MLDINIANFITVALMSLLAWAAFAFGAKYMGYGSLVA